MTDTTTDSAPAPAPKGTGGVPAVGAASAAKHRGADQPQRYYLSHTTRYDYGGSVDVSHNLLHLRLRSTGVQIARAQTISIDPAPATTARHVDFFGNTVDYVVLDAPHQHLEITSTAEVEVLPPRQHADTAAPPWDDVARSVGRQASGPDITVPFLAAPSPQTLANDDLIAWSEPLFTPGRPLLELARALNELIHTDFTYNPNATDITTPVDQAFAQRAGVCQDFAHVALAVLRARRVPARYVSGYIRTYPPPGKPRLIGADASHAWFAVFCPGLGWVDFDPTNNCRLSTDHVTIGWGRDYSDVAPVSGVILGGGGNTLTVGVDLAPAEEIEGQPIA